MKSSSIKCDAKSWAKMRFWLVSRHVECTRLVDGSELKGRWLRIASHVSLGSASDIFAGKDGMTSAAAAYRMFNPRYFHSVWI